MDSEAREKFIQAGKIASEVREFSKDWIKDGMLLVEIAEKLEGLIREKGGHPGFPVNLSLNSQAAHYTPSRNDKSIFNSKDVLKVDLGVHIDGYVADTAYTLSFDNSHKKLLDASKEALRAAIELCKPGQKLSNISATIEDTIKHYGYKPVANLSGHGVGRYVLHSDPQIPNVRFRSNYKLEEDEIIAIEPFATDGNGAIKDAEECLIFRFKDLRTTRNPEGRKIIDFVQSYGGLPFAQRWIETGLNISEFKIRFAIRDLVMNDIIKPYPVLIEKPGSFVSQHEHTVIVKDDPIVTTL
ncbi:MAG: type II methionyl aminopeptidase [Candidatus Aenigmarchaeota archaeon]|nr:type II methionyl aminopeptidase [Candidatus Aenigmarchaeota archaeon]